MCKNNQLVQEKHRKHSRISKIILINWVDFFFSEIVVLFYVALSYMISLDGKIVYN